MAAARAKTQPVGSTGWIENEREQASHFVEQEAEEFGYSVRNELEWLHEHMADIFSTNPVNFADVFKTPGKLRGKTPRTARKQNALAPRQPLGDIFAPNVPAPQSAQKTTFFDKVAHFKIADDAENQSPAHRPTSRSKSPQRIGKNVNTDSGYHGMTEDEMEIENRAETATQSSQYSYVQKVPLREDQPPAQRINGGSTEDGVSSDDSFLSAREDLTSRNVSKEQLQVQEHPQEMDVDESAQVDGAATTQHLEREVIAHAADDADDARTEQDQDMDEAESHSQSDVSSPEKPLQRKSSFTFTALPAREPLTGKKSIGTRNSQVDGRNSTLGRSFGAKSFGVGTNDDDEEPIDTRSEESKAHTKTSTQLLHERINMLGKTKEPRASKSVHQNVLSGQATYPHLPVVNSSKPAEPAEDSDDDWIAPSKPTQAKAGAAVEPEQARRDAHFERPPMHQKSVSTTHIPSPSRPAMEPDNRSLKAMSVSNPSFTSVSAEIQSTTPAGSPASKKNHDGPLSASKNKLYSVLKSAKSIFASSASASAAAKLEAHNSSPSRSPTRNVSNESKTAAVFNMPGALYSDRQLPGSPSRSKSVISLISTNSSRKTRSSSESDKKREKELKEQQKAAEELEKAREKERQKAAKQQQERENAEQAEAAKREKAAQKQLPERPTTADSDKADGQNRPPPPPPKNGGPAGKLRAPVRIGKPTQSAKPAPVSIRIASQSQRLHHPPSSSLSKSQHETSAPAVPPKQNATRPGSAQGSVRGSNAPGNSRLKALEAAARKKEADERAAQEKADKKKELERKRAAKAEEERRAEEEKRAAEQQRLHEAKIAAQRQAERQAAEAKRREEVRIEQQRQQEEAQKARAAHDLAEAIKRERAQQQQAAQTRNDVGGTIRQLVKSVVPELPGTRPPIQPNPAKPAKRVWVPDDDEPSQPQTHQPQRPGMQRGPPSFQQKDAKRRRTDEEERPEERASVMGPPKRPSTMRKESTLAKFPHGYTHAPPAANHHPSMFKATVTAQHQLQHGPKPGMPVHPSQLAQVSNVRIPFADNANPPGTAPHYSQVKAYHGHENQQPGAAQQGKFKTPVRPTQAPKSAKSSPLYANGENIELPDILTDSEDEESDADEDDNTGFRAPSWTASPALRELLHNQQLLDPEKVFGPIGELKMEEVFRNNKNPERMKKFRDRTSSAAWVQNGDAVTSAEKRRDMELRERVAREGGWRYDPSPKN